MGAPGAIDLAHKSAFENLGEIAKFAIGSKEVSGDPCAEFKGGAGRIGMICGHVVKFNTHASERRSGPKANQAMRDSCNELREKLYTIAGNLNLGVRTLADIRSKLGLNGNGQASANAKLLDRKVVVSVINLIAKDSEIRGKGIDVWAKMNLSVQEIKDLASTKVDATSGKTVKRDMHFQSVLPNESLPVTTQSEVNGRTRIEQHGSLGTSGAKAYANMLADQVKIDANEDRRTIAKDVPRGLVIHFKNEDVSKENYPNEFNSGVQSEEDIDKFLTDKFENQFPTDTDFARCIKFIANQTLWNTGSSVENPLEEGNLIFKLGKYRPEEHIEISSVEGNSVTIRGTRSFIPASISKLSGDIATGTSPVDMESSRVTTEYVIRVTKLGQNDRTEGENIAQVGNSHFRFDVDPISSRIDRDVVLLKDEDKEHPDELRGEVQ